MVNHLNNKVVFQHNCRISRFDLAVRVGADPNVGSHLTNVQPLSIAPAHSGVAADRVKRNPKILPVTHEQHEGMSEAILLRVKIKSDKLEKVIGLLPKVRRQLDSSGVIATVLRRIFEQILVIEELYTESLFLEQTDGGTFVLWYMEAEDMSHFYEGYEAALKSHHPVAIVAQKIVQTSIEEPEEALSYSGDKGDLELFIHGTNPERP